MPDGKQLEALVAYIERTFGGDDVSVTTNRKLFEEGIQLAEFDVEVRGSVGSTKIDWLIECRDRPSDGGAPAEWIQQLYGRREAFGFNKVTAVSTTGFSAGAIAQAKQLGIELREVESLDPAAFSTWFAVEHFKTVTRHASLSHADLLLRTDTKPEVVEAAIELITTSNPATVELHSSDGKCTVSINQLFIAVAVQSGQFDDMRANQPARTVQINAQYQNDDCFLVKTRAGSASLCNIIFHGELEIREGLLPLVRSEEYRETNKGRVISQLVSYAPIAVQGIEIVIEFHHIPETGETHLTARRLT